MTYPRDDYFLVAMPWVKCIHEADECLPSLESVTPLQVGTARDKHKLAYIEVVVSRNGCINSEKIQRFYHVCTLCDCAHCYGNRRGVHTW